MTANHTGLGEMPGRKVYEKVMLVSNASSPPPGPVSPLLCAAQLLIAQIEQDVEDNESEQEQACDDPADYRSYDCLEDPANERDDCEHKSQTESQFDHGRFLSIGANYNGW
jgi:hypothetical protein